MLKILTLQGLCKEFFCFWWKAPAVDLSLVNYLLSEMKVWSVPNWLTGVHQWLFGFAIFLSGWYLNGHININSIFSPFCYFQTGFIISETFLIFFFFFYRTRTGRKKRETAEWDRKRWKGLRNRSFPGNGRLLGESLLFFSLFFFFTNATDRLFVFLNVKNRPKSCYKTSGCLYCLEWQQRVPPSAQWKLGENGQCV